MSFFNMLIELAFSVALLVNAALFIPQIIRLYKAKDSREVSLLTFAGFLTIQVITVAHGLVVKDYILVAGFSAAIITCGITTWLIVWYRIRNP